jgi:hypothetical protein
MNLLRCNPRNMIRWCMALSLCTLLLAASPLVAQDPIPLASRRELFVDGYLIDKLDRAELRLQTPRDEGVAFPLDLPWEGKFSAYTTILKAGDKYRAYYRGLPQAKSDNTLREATCVAESPDGKTWTKPKLGLFEMDGTKENNIVLTGEAAMSHNFCPMIDGRKGVPASERYKALSGSAKTGLVAWVSGDGLRWHKLREEAVIKGGAFDSQNVPLWSETEQCYVCYYRVGVDRVRRIARVTSPDFVNWSPPMLMEYGLVSDSSIKLPIEHLYTNQTSTYFRAPHIYTAIAARFFPGKRVLTPEQATRIGVDPGYFNDCSDGIFMTTRGGGLYDRTFMEGFIKPGLGLENWTSRTNYPALNVVQTGPGEMSLYVNQNYGQPTAHLRRYSLRIDGFAALHADYNGGEMLTKPFTFTGKELELNFSTSAAGSIKAEILDAAGQSLPGFTLADSLETIGNELDRAIQWKAGSDVSSLAGKPVRLKFVLKDADVFSLRFK